MWKVCKSAISKDAGIYAPFLTLFFPPNYCPFLCLHWLSQVPKSVSVTDMVLVINTVVYSQIPELHRRPGPHPPDARSVISIADFLNTTSSQLKRATLPSVSCIFPGASKLMTSWGEDINILRFHLNSEQH